MKDPFDRTKVVLRHLPPTFSQSALTDQIDVRFAGLYNWISFCPGKNSQKHHKYSRVYIAFKRPEDVVEFAKFFNGHVFVNEKGAQFKTIVEYAPSQQVPKYWSKKDGREGTIFKDPEYLEFLEFLAKPVENLPSAEMQLEKKEAERIGSAKESPVITPLMDFIRQKRAAKVVSQRSSSNGKLSRKAMGASHGNSRSASTKRGSEKRRVSTSMYILKDNAKNAHAKEKSTYILVPRQVDQQNSDSSVSASATTATEAIEDGSVPGTDGAISGYSWTVDLGKKKVLLLKGKEREIAQASGGASEQQSVTSPVRNVPGSTSFKRNQRREASGRMMIRSILSNKEARQNQSSNGVLSEQQSQSLNLEKGKQRLQSTIMRSVLKDQLSSVSQAACSTDCDSKRPLDNKVIGSDLHAFDSIGEKQEKRTRNKDRPDRGVWTLRRSDGSHANLEGMTIAEHVPASTLTATQLSDSLGGMTIAEHGPASGVSKLQDDVVDTESSNKSSFSNGKPRSLDAPVQNLWFGRDVHELPLISVEMKVDLPNASRNGEVKTLGSGCNSFSSLENGSLRHFGRRGSAQVVKDVDGSTSLSEGKPSKRGNATGYGSHERQVWVQKSGSGS